MLVNCRTARATQTLSQHMSQAWQPVPVMGSSTPQGGECEEETIRFGLEVLYIDSWARHRIYTAFKDVLGSGMHYHLQNNELLRDIFGLGPVLVLDAAALKACKISRFEKHLYNAAAFKARTKARSRARDKRADIL